MKKHQQILCIIISMVILGAKTSEAFVVQNAGKAFSYGNYVQDSAPKKPQTNNSAVDYSDMANKMIVRPQGTTRISMFERASSNVVIEVGKVIEIFLPQEKGSSWNIDINNQNLVRVEHSEDLDDGRLLIFLALANGKTTVYLDNIRSKDEGIDVIQSKIIRFDIR